MKAILDLDRYPIDRLDSHAGCVLLDQSRTSLEQEGMFTLSGFIRPAARDSILEEVEPVLRQESFTHTRYHNIYFEDEVTGVADDHPALRELQTTNHTVCGDQITGSSICRIYEWQPLAEFLARVMGRKRLYLMDDAMAALNILEYRSGEQALNWHFDRSEFTTTLLLCAADRGGEFQYRSALRTANDPNFEGVAALLADDDPEIRTLPMTAGTLCIFRGVETAHRVTPVTGTCSRIVAVLSYYERPDVRFSKTERLGFYGRAE
jgi:alkylated DNA repair dioxygenase AlkB